MDSLIEAVLVAILVGVFTLLGVWLSSWQERKSAREAREARKEEMIYEKQLSALEEGIKWLTLMNAEWRKVVEVYEKQSAVPEEIRVMGQKMVGLVERSGEMMALISTYLPLETKDAFQEYSEQAIASMEAMGERLLRGEEGDFEGTKERLTAKYDVTVLKMREHLDIKESVGAEEATRIRGRRRLKLKSWAIWASNLTA